MLSSPQLSRQHAAATGIKQGAVKWAVIFPFHGETGTQRLAMVQVAWDSLTHAIQEATKAHPDWMFDVLVVDDTKHGSWVPKSDFERIWICSAAEGCSNPGDISMHTKRGYHWGCQTGADLITNVDSDLLLVSDFFSLMHSAYSKQTTKGECSTPIISGYSSRVNNLAYGANYLFNRKVTSDVLNCVSCASFVIMP
jgi:hypothetical protein